MSKWKSGLDKSRGWRQRKLDRGMGRSKEPVVPSEYDVLTAGLTDEQILASGKIRAWIRGSYTRRFVPESILKAMGL